MGIVLPKELQKQMFLFFSKTSIPRKKRFAEEENNIQNHETDSLQREDISTNLKENWEYLDSKERQNFLKQFVKAIVIDAEKLSNGRTIPRIKKLNST